jgi:hypothetical protein
VAALARNLADRFGSDAELAFGVIGFQPRHSVCPSNTAA